MGETRRAPPLPRVRARARRRLPPAMSSIDDAIAQNDMIVFSSSTCPFCVKALGALKDSGYEPVVVEADGNQRKELAEKCGSSSVPKVFVKGNFIGGCNDGGMGGTLPLLANGKIKELMGK